MATKRTRNYKQMPLAVALAHRFHHLSVWPFIISLYEETHSSFCLFPIVGDDSMLSLLKLIIER